VPTTGVMSYLHRCPFCEWEREAGSSTMLDPRCERCGCLLESLTVGTPPASRMKPAPSPAVVGRVTALVTSILLAPVVGAVAKLGYDRGGPELAIAGVILAVLIACALGMPSPER
jgi:hypothetical protein